MVRLLLPLLTLGIAIAVAYGCLSAPQAAALAALTLWFALATTTALFLWYWFRWEREAGGWLRRETWTGWRQRMPWRRLALVGGITLMGTVFIARSQVVDYKSILDEHAIASVANDMHLKRTAAVPSRVYYASFKRHVLAGGVDSRPAAFPFLVSLTHDLFGYQLDRPMTVNLVLGAVVIFGLSWILLRLWGVGACLFGAICLVTIPIFAAEMTSGGAEMAMLAFGVVLYGLLVRWMARPGPEGLAVIGLWSLLFAQTRWEALVLVLPAVGIIAWQAWRTKQVRVPWIWVILPLLALPAICQLRVFEADPGLWELSGSGKSVPFSLSYFQEMSGRALYFFFDPEERRANHIYLAGLACVAAVAFLVLLRRRIALWGTLSPTARVGFLFGCSLLILGALVLAYAWPLDRKPTSQLALPLFVGMVCLVAWLWAELPWRVARLGLALSLGAFLFAWQLPKLTQRPFEPDINTALAYRCLEPHLASLTSDHDVFITPDTAYFDLHNRSATNYGSIHRFLPQLAWLLQRSHHPRFLIWELETYDAMAQQWRSLNPPLDPRVQTRIIWEESPGFLSRVRLREVIAIEGVEPLLKLPAHLDPESKAAKESLLFLSLP